MTEKFKYITIGNAENKYQFLEKCTQKAAKEALGERENVNIKKKKTWWTEDLKNLVEEKKM